MLWRLLALHAGHRIAALYEDTKRLNQVFEDGDPAMIGGDADGDIPVDVFLEGWREADPDVPRLNAHGLLRCTVDDGRLWLGAAHGRSPAEVSFFRAGVAGAPGNSTYDRVNRSLWRFLADHVMHELTVDVVTELPATAIGAVGGESFGDYVAGWPG
ncbi:hypothetical protein ACIBSW_12225 [Actinoplanes sp. NPDC049668]|uniref:hypothetical protein n=1 Tax=Actinoplanes sp. NPDC049668 TaxID=3363904 RepID=UPI0037A9EC9E